MRPIEAKWNHRRFPTLLSFLKNIDPEGKRGYLVKEEDVGMAIWPLSRDSRFRVTIEDHNVGSFVYLTIKPHGFEFRQHPRK